MARRKPNNLYPVKDLDAANAALARIASIKRSIAEVESKLNENIDLLKAEADVTVAPLQAELAAVENGLLAFAEFSKDEVFAGKRSKELDFGSLGYRRSKEIKPKPKHTWKMVLGFLKRLDFKEAIRTKESVNKEELKKWPDERLDQVGARRVGKDTFWYEIDEQKVTAKV